MQKSAGTFGMNPSQLVDVAFIKYSTGNNKREMLNKKPLFDSDTGFLEGSITLRRSKSCWNSAPTVRSRNTGEQTGLC